MKKLYLILLVFVFNSIICFGSEQMELSSRLGKTISVDSRNYFGLFPEVKDFKSAVLYKDTGYNYIEITAGKSEAKSKIILSDSAVSTLAYVIDNFEGIISEPAKYKLNGKLISGLIRISTQINKKAKPVSITLRDSTKFSGFILYADSSIVVTTPDSAYRPTSANFKITSYSDIYYISNVDYPIIDGTIGIFLMNLKSFHNNTLFKNVFGIKVIPPEVLKYLSENPFSNEQEIYESMMDFDSLYFKRMMVSLDNSYEFFYPNKLKLLYFEDISNMPFDLVFDKNYSLGINFNYAISKHLKIELGYHFKKNELRLTKNVPHKSILGNAFNFDLQLKLWSSKKIRYEPQRFYSYIYGGIQVTSYDYEVSSSFLDRFKTYEDIGIDDNPKQSYHSGIIFKYNINHNNCIFLSAFINYHKDWGIIFFNNHLANSYQTSSTTRYIDFIFSYGFKVSYGIEI